MGLEGEERKVWALFITWGKHGVDADKVANKLLSLTGRIDEMVEEGEDYMHQPYKFRAGQNRRVKDGRKKQRKEKWT